MIGIYPEWYVNYVPNTVNGGVNIIGIYPEWNVN